MMSTRNNLNEEYAAAALKHRLPSMFALEYGAEPYAIRLRADKLIE
jgi:hypothetical protein